MEITLRKPKEKQEIKVSLGNIVSISGSYLKDILANLISDYSAIYICNDNLFFAAKTVKDELVLFDNLDNDLTSSLIHITEYEDFLDKKIDELSSSEKIFLNIIRNINLDNKIIILDDIFKYLDYNNQKKIRFMLDKLKENDYIIFITSSDVNLLYMHADYSIVWNKKMFMFDKCDKVYTDVEMLLENKFSIPTLSMITYKAKKDKNVKLYYRKDVRDIIKDIYKHV